MIWSRRFDRSDRLIPAPALSWMDGPGRRAEGGVIAMDPSAEGIAEVAGFVEQRRQEQTGRDRRRRREKEFGRAGWGLGKWAGSELSLICADYGH